MSIKGHAIIAGAVACLTLAGATSWALTRSEGSADDPGRGPGSMGLASAEAVEGFGSAGPLASRSSVSRPSPRPSANPPSSPAPGAPTTPAESASVKVAEMEATYVMVTWQGGFQVTFIVNNPTASPVLWKLRAQLPAGAQFGHSWSAETERSGDVLTFSPPKWDNGNPRPLAPGTTHTFGFIALQPGSEHRLLSCTVDGVPCRPAQP